MPWLYVYSPDDFVGGLPEEQNASAAGSVPFTMTLSADAVGTMIEIVDTDGMLDESDTTQTVASTINLDGQTILAGTTMHSAYDLLNPSSGMKVTTVMFGGNGFEQGPVHGLISTAMLMPGQSYTFQQERSSYLQANAYTDSHPKQKNQ